MTPASSPEVQLRAENAALRARLEEAEDTLRAIRCGEVEALVVETAEGPQVFTLQGLDAESNRLRGEILAQVSDSVIAVDLEDCVTYLNAAAERLYRISAANALGRQLSHIFSRQWPSAEAEAAAWVALRERGEWRGELIHCTHDGRELQVEAWLTLLRDAAGMVTAVRDISERKRAGTELADATRRLEFALRSAPVALFNQDSDLRYTWMYNPALGYNADQVIGKRDGDLFERVQDAANTEAMKREVMRTGARERRDVLIHTEGVARYYDLLVEPLVDKAGATTGVACAAIEITERKRAEAEAQGVSVLLDTLLQTAPIGFCFLDRDLRFVRINERLAEINGVPAEAHLGRHASEIVPTLVETFQAVTARILATGEAELNHEFSGETPAAPGVTRFWNESWYPVRDGAGEVMGFGGIVEDITERKRAEDALRKSQQFTRSVLENLFAFVGVMTADGTLTYANRAPMEAAGIPASEVLGKKFWDCHWWNYSPEIQAQLREACERAAGGAIVRYDVPVRMAGDTRVWIDFQVAPLRDTEGRVTHLIPTAMDIAVRRAAEEKLRDSEARFRALTTASSEVLFSMSADWSEMRPLDGRSFLASAEAGSRTWLRDYNHPEDLSKIMARVRESIRTKSIFELEHRRRRLDGTWGWAFSRAVPILDAHGEITDWFGTASDVTLRKTVEIQSRQLAAELSDADRRKDEFLATLAHELRNPLAPIRNGLQLMKMPGVSAAAAEQIRSMMERQITHMVRLIDDLMDVSRITRGKLLLRTEHVALAVVVNTAVEASRPLVEQMGQELSVTLPQQALTVNADLTRLAQVFLNLLNNAAKYSRPGGHIHLHVEGQGSEVVVSVKDTGIGIAAEQLPHIFEMFAQVDRSLDTSRSGLGVGLALVKRLVEMHGGRVGARSEGLGTGSEFVVRLPLIVEVSEVPESGAATERAVRSSLRIMVVDDNRDGADSLAELLTMMGNHTRTAYDGQSGVDAVGEFRPDVILLDIGMPKLNGYEACRRIREQAGGESVVLIALTGWGQDDDRRRSHSAGFDHHMVKPVDPVTLMELLGGLEIGISRLAIETTQHLSVLK